MAKLCRKCGNLVDDSAYVCNACGAPMTDGYPQDPKTVSAESNPYAYTPAPQQPPAPNPYEYYPQPVAPAVNTYMPASVPAPKKKKTGLIIGISAVALVLVAALVLLVILPLAGTDAFGLNWFKSAKNATPKDCVETFFLELADNNSDGALDCIYEAKYSDTMRSLFKTYLISEMESNSSFKAIKSMGKDNIKSMMTITITDEQAVSSSDASSYKSQLSAYGIPTDKIETIESATVTVNGQKQANQWVFAKAEGEWYILSSAMSGF